MSTLKRVTLKKLFSENGQATTYKVAGWVRSVRKNKTFSFVTLSDGSCQQNLQIVVDQSVGNYADISSALAGTCAEFEGSVKRSEGGQQNLEMVASYGKVLGPVDATYPLQKKAATLELLREQAHFRARTNLFGAIFRVRHTLAQATHEFFSSRGFFYMNSPIITGQDGEGAGEMFRVTTLDMNKLPRNDKGEVDYTKDYFGKETSLCVTGQLEGECHALGLGAIYTFGPTFRSENSNTNRHLSEFWMIEPEISFCDLDELAELATDYVKHLIHSALEKCPDELAFLAKRNEEEGGGNHLEVLKLVANKEFKKISYTEAVEILQKSGAKFDFPTTWGSELQTEHERYLTEKHFGGPVIVTDYPKGFKAFYMKQNDDGKTVRAMDVLVPGVGEIIGGSQREESYDKITTRMKELGMKIEDYWWYLELRKFGSAPHAGFGLGFERAVMYITGMKNIRDVIPFPRTPRNAEF